LSVSLQSFVYVVVPAFDPGGKVSDKVDAEEIRRQC
jgi:hypothetical protein